jgi:GT2 family glycosyltransferase
MPPVDDSSSMSAVCVVVVNWNGWRDAVACLESLFALGGARMRVVVCDNASTDASVPELDRYLRERLLQWQPAAGEPGLLDPEPGDGVLSVHLLRLPDNFGYAGAINVGIEWARKRWTPRGFWLLNNDVQAQPGALDALVAAHGSMPDAGICGSVLLEWDEPERIQAVAGIYRRWLGVGWHDKDLPAQGGDVTVAVDYPIGASMYVGTDYLNKVGLMDPSYFLYCEEMDWAERGRRQGYRPLVALKSRLRHKEGASTGSRGGVRNKSLLSERYGVINRLRITRKLWPYYLPMVWSSLLLVVLDRLLHGEMARAALVLRLMFSWSQWLGCATWPTPSRGRDEVGVNAERKDRGR